MLRLSNFAEMTERWRQVRRVSRRGLLRAGAAVTFAAMSIRDD